MAASRPEMQRLRRDMQIVFQDPYASLNPRMRVRNIVGEPLLIHGIGTDKERQGGSPSCSRWSASRPSTASATRTSSPAASDSASASPARWRSAHASSSATSRSVALDVSIQAQIINLLEDLQDELKLTYLFIAHDLSVVQHISDRVAVMYLGKIVEIADSSTSTTRPLHPYTESLLSAVPIPDPVIGTRAKTHHPRGRRAQPGQPAQGLRVPPRCSRMQVDPCTVAMPPLVATDGGRRRLESPGRLLLPDSLRRRRDRDGECAWSDRGSPSRGRRRRACDSWLIPRWSGLRGRRVTSTASRAVFAARRRAARGLALAAGGCGGAGNPGARRRRRIGSSPRSTAGRSARVR